MEDNMLQTSVRCEADMEGVIKDIVRRVKANTKKGDTLELAIKMPTLRLASILMENLVSTLFEHGIDMDEDTVNIHFLIKDARIPDSIKDEFVEEPNDLDMEDD